VVFWKAGYGAGLDCVTSANRENSIPELAKILCDNLYWDSSIASKVADVIFGPKPKSNLVHWKKDVTRALEEALILTSKESKQNFYGNLPY